MTKKIFLRGVTMLLKEEKTAVIEANRTRERHRFSRSTDRYSHKENQRLNRALKDT